jgi:hypothetical protein
MLGAEKFGGVSIAGAVTGIETSNVTTGILIYCSVVVEGNDLADVEMIRVNDGAAPAPQATCLTEGSNPTTGWAWGSSAQGVNKACFGRASAVRASRPAARSAHAAPHLIHANLDAPLPCGVLLWGSDPADPLVSGQRSDLGPQPLHCGIGFEGFSEVRWQPMHRTARESSSCHVYTRVCGTQRSR